MTRRVNFFNVQTPFFRPLWRRVVTTLACLAWTAYEVTLGLTMWAIIFGAASVYLAWEFFVAFDPEPDGDEEESGTG